MTRERTCLLSPGLLNGKFHLSDELRELAKGSTCLLRSPCSQIPLSCPPLRSFALPAQTIFGHLQCYCFKQ